MLVVGIPVASQAAELAPGNSAQQRNTIAQDTVVNTPGMFQNEALLSMAHVQAAVYDAVTSIQGGYRPYGPRSRRLRERRPTQRWWRGHTGR